MKWRTGWTGLILVVALVLVGVAAWIVATRLLNNAEQIQKRPTRAQLLAVLARNRDISRRACRVSNTRFAALRAVVAGQAPSAKTTDYYATHPQELHTARLQFNRILRVLAPRSCIKLFPVPTLKDVDGGGDALSPGQNKQPP